MSNRVDRGFSRGGEPPFTEAQRIWLLERDFDQSDQQLAEFRVEVRGELEAIRKLVSTRLNVLAGVGFTLLVSVIGVLVAVLAGQP